MDDTKEEQRVLSPDERRAIQDAVIAKYGTNLRPGEVLSIDVVQDKTHAHVTVHVEMHDESERLEIEAVVMEEDNSNVSPTMKPDDRFDLAIDFVDAQLATYFENDRFERFHDDWRVYDFENVAVRFRGLHSKPSLEKLADAWLETAEKPDGGDDD